MFSVVMRHVFVLTIGLALSAFADVPSGDQPRLALLIANVTYQDATFTSLPPGTLVGAVHLYDVLNRAGFKVYKDAPLVNLTNDEMDQAFDEFAGAIPDRALVVVYFVGHGFEYRSVNYLVPVDASADNLQHSPRLESRLEQLTRGKSITSIVIVDACRNNALSQQGMVKPSTAIPNSLIAFPTQPGRTARADAIYTDALVRYLREPIRIEDVLQKTRNDVLRATRGLQEPQEFGGLREPVYVVRPASELTDGLLMTSETYYVLSNGRKRRIPDSAAFEALGFNASFAVKPSAEELSRIPDGEPYPSVDTNVLTSKTCNFYLFWGMKWCLPRSLDIDQSVPLAFRKNGPARALLPNESAAIARGDLAGLPNGANFRFGDSAEVYRSEGGSLRSISQQELAALSPALTFPLPAAMRPLLQPQKRDSNQISGSRIVADPSRHQIFVTMQSSVIAYDLLGKGNRVIDVKPGVPGLMVLAEKKALLFVADSESHVIHIIDVRSRKRLDKIPQKSPAPTRITGLALSPDEQRLYVANQGGETVATTGSISVFDLTRNELVSTIRNVNCPEGMSITPDGDQIYLASQCGKANDPVFVIDTGTEEVTAIPGFQVGHNVVVNAVWKKAYVSRVDHQAVDSAGEVVRIPAQLSVIDTSRKQLLKSWPSDLHSFAVTPDGNYVLAIGGLHMDMIDARTDRIINTTQFETPPAGVTVASTADGNDVMCYVWLPQTPRLFFAGLSELVRSPSH